MPVRTVSLDSRDGRASQELVLDGSAGQLALPLDVPLWLRVSAAGRDGGYRQARFSIGKDRCSVWQSLLDQFGGGRCVLGLDAVFDPARSPGSGRLKATLELRRLDPRRPNARPQSVAGTQGATGAVWDGATAILVTLGAQSAEPGLYRVDLATSTRTLLYKPSPMTGLTAPLPLPGGHDHPIAVVEEQDGIATLLILHSGTVQRRIPLGGPVQQFLRSDQSGKQVLGVRLHATGVELFSVVIPTGIETVGGGASLLFAFKQAASDGLGLLEYEDVATNDGWEIVLIDRNGRPLRELLVGPGHDLLSAWRPDGAELLYLGQVDSERDVKR